MFQKHILPNTPKYTFFEQIVNVSGETADRVAQLSEIKSEFKKAKLTAEERDHIGIAWRGVFSKVLESAGLSVETRTGYLAIYVDGLELLEPDESIRRVHEPIGRPQVYPKLVTG